MAAMIVSLSGKVTRRGVGVKETKRGKMMITCALCVDVMSDYDRRKAAEKGEESGDVIWVTVRAFGRTGETLQMARPGDVLTVSGEMTRYWWTPKDSNEQKEAWDLFARDVICPRADHERNMANEDNTYDQE